jgi:tetratricopeptide (TPR) repeat protein
MTAKIKRPKKTDSDAVLDRLERDVRREPSRDDEVLIHLLLHGQLGGQKKQCRPRQALEQCAAAWRDAHNLNALWFCFTVREQLGEKQFLDWLSDVLSEQEARELAKALNENRSFLTFLQGVAALQEGQSWVREGAWQNGLERLREALNFFRSTDFDVPYSKAITFLAIGDVHQRFGDYEVARMFYGDAERNFRQIGAKTGEAMAWLRAGTVEIQLQEITEARAHIEAARRSFEEQGDTERVELCDQWLALVREIELIPEEIAV